MVQRAVGCKHLSRHHLYTTTHMLSILTQMYFLHIYTWTDTPGYRHIATYPSAIPTRAHVHIYTHPHHCADTPRYGHTPAHSTSFPTHPELTYTQSNIHTYTCADKPGYRHTSTQLYISTPIITPHTSSHHIWTDIPSYKHTFTQTYISILPYICMQTLMPVLIQWCINKYTHTYTYLHSTHT